MPFLLATIACGRSRGLHQTGTGGTQLRPGTLDACGGFTIPTRNSRVFNVG